MAEEMIGFEDAMKRLQLSEQELQNLVTGGALRAYRSGGQMKFKMADLEGVKKERETEPTIIIPAAGAPAAAGQEISVEMPEDLVVDESAQTVVGQNESGEGGTPTVAIGEQGTEELVFDDKELEVLPLEEEAAGTQAAGEAATVVEDGTAAEITVSDEEGAAAGGKPRSSASGKRVLSSRVGSAVSRRRSAAFEVRRGDAIWAVVLGVAAAVALFTLSVFGVMVAKGYRAGQAPNDSTYVAGYLKKAYDSMSNWGEGK